MTFMATFCSKQPLPVKQIPPRLHQYANENSVQFAADALKYKLVDGLKYDDEVKDEIKDRLKVGKYDKINFVSLGKYAMAVDYKQTGTEKIAVIYAQGDIVDGKGDQENDWWRYLPQPHS